MCFSRRCLVFIKNNMVIKGNYFRADLATENVLCAQSDTDQY